MRRRGYACNLRVRLHSGLSCLVQHPRRVLNNCALPVIGHELGVVCLRPACLLLGSVLHLLLLHLLLDRRCLASYLLREKMRRGTVNVLVHNLLSSSSYLL